MPETEQTLEVGQTVRVITEHGTDDWTGQFNNAEGVVVKLEGFIDFGEESGNMVWVDLPSVEEPDGIVAQLLNAQKRLYNLPITAWSFFENELEVVDA